MSVKQMALVWELDLPKPDKFLLLALADHADPDGNNAFPSVGRLAHMTGDSRRTVQRLLRRLETAGLIVPTVHGGKRWRAKTKDGTVLSGRSTCYSLQLSKGVKLAPFTTGGASPTSPKGRHPRHPMGGLHDAQTIREPSDIHGLFELTDQEKEGLPEWLRTRIDERPQP